MKKIIQYGQLILAVFFLAFTGQAIYPSYAYDPNKSVLDSNPVPSTVITSGSAVSASNPLAISIIQSGVPVASAYPLETKLPLQQDLIGNINSFQPTRSYGFTVGNNNIVQNVRCDLWEGPTCIYVYPVTAQQMTFVSSSASDAASGVGAQQVHVHYLDNNYIEQTEIVTLNGVTPVNTVSTNILRVNSLHVTAVGTTGVPVGNISMTNTGGTVTYGYISAGHNTARQAIYTVPGNKQGYISHWQASSGTTTGTHFTRISIRATQHAGVYWPGVFIMVDEVGTLNNGIEITLPIPIRIPPKTDVKMSAISDAANANAVALGAIMGWFEQ